MSTIFTLFMILFIIASILLVFIIMAQNPKGGGLSGTFGGASSATFGVQRTNDFMEKATWTLGTVIVVLILLSIILTGKPSQTLPTMAAPVKTETPVKQAPANTAPTTQMPATN